MSARRVRGLQIGRDNLQLNHFEYRVERCDVDFQAVLDRPDVREQLRRLAADPGNRALRDDVDSLLGRRPFLQQAPRARVVESTMTTSGDDAGGGLFETFLFVRDSSGVQIAEGGRQVNFFLYVIAPTIDAAHLLREDPHLRSDLIDQICASSAGATGTDLHDQLSSAVENAVLDIPGLQTSGTVVDLRKHSRVDVGTGTGCRSGSAGIRRTTSARTWQYRSRLSPVSKGVPRIWRRRRAPNARSGSRPSSR